MICLVQVVPPQPLQEDMSGTGNTSRNTATGSNKNKKSSKPIGTPKKIDVVNINDSAQFFDAESNPDRFNNASDISISKDKCPCKVSDKQSTYEFCAKCKQGWHNRCCNLNGLTQVAIKKLKEWLCPRCYVCPIMPKLSAMLCSDMAAVKDHVSSLCEFKENTAASFEDLQAEMSALKEQLAQLTKVEEPKSPLALPAELSVMLENVKKMSPESISSIETGLSELSSQVTELKDTITSQKQPSPLHPSTRPGNFPSGTPNTESPHARKIKTPCSPYLKL